jgi:protocatechuate 3,4-dioxygenase beta subunit
MASRTPKRLDRRQALAALGAGVGAAMAACSGSPTAADTATTSTGATPTGTGSGACVISPTEKRGPYPGTAGMINNAAFFRRDITDGRSGLPLTLALTVVDVNNACAAVSGVQVEAWQCDAGGTSSEYGAGAGQTFLRGVQTTDANGQVTFTTIYPGWYAGRATHIHVDVYRSGAIVKSTQIAFPEDVTRTVYATGVYASHGQNSTTNAGDMVFSDGTTASWQRSAEIRRAATRRRCRSASR